MSSSAERLEGAVAEVLDKYTVVINRGSDQEVSEGDSFYLYRNLGPFTDPETGDSLGSTKDIIVEVEVDNVEAKFCIASTPKVFSGAKLIPAFALGNYEQKELPISNSSGKDSKGQNAEDDKEVRVGTPAFLVPSQSARAETSIRTDDDTELAEKD